MFGPLSNALQAFTAGLSPRHFFFEWASERVPPPGRPQDSLCQELTGRISCLIRRPAALAEQRRGRKAQSLLWRANGCVCRGSSLLWVGSYEPAGLGGRTLMLMLGCHEHLTLIAGARAPHGTDDAQPDAG